MNSKTCITVNEIRGPRPVAGRSAWLSRQVPKFNRFGHAQPAVIRDGARSDARGRTRPRSILGFTLIEMIGVFAVVALLAAALIPQIIRRVDQAAVTKEEADLGVMAGALTQSILRTKSIPAYTGLAPAIANDMAQPLAIITETARHFPRAFLTDRNFRVDGAVLPYTQTTNGSSVTPAAARVMIVSSLSRALPIASTNNLSDVEFQAIWDTPEGAKPSTAAWTSFGSSDDLHIKKLNLATLFHQLILTDHDSANGARYSIDSTNTAIVPIGGLGWNKYYLDGTAVGLHNPSGLVQTKYLLKRSISFVFEQGAWAGRISGGESFDPLADAFAARAYSFYTSVNNPAANTGGASQFSVLVLMYSFLYDFTLWANECPHFNDHGTSSSPEATLLKNVVGPTASGSLGAVSGSGGLLK